MNWLEWEIILKFCELEDISIPCKKDIFVVDRDVNPVGFMTEIENRSTTHSLNYSRNVYELIPTAISFPSGSSLGFLLFFTDGKLSAIEGFVYGEQWPNADTRLEFTELSSAGEA